MLQIVPLTYICECGKSPKVADTHKAKDKPLSSFGQDMRELIQHGCDYTLQPCKLEIKGYQE